MRKEVIGDAVLILGDAAEVVDGLSGVELVITDPPYSSGARTDSERQVRGAMLRSMEDGDWFSHDAMTSWGFGWFIRSVFSTLRQRMTEGAHAYVFIDWRQTPNLYGMLEATGFRVDQRLVWAKPHFGMGAYWRNQHENIIFASNGMPAAMIDRGMGSVLRHPAVFPEQRVHPTEKPIGLLESIIAAVPGGMCFDPFMGSGSTGAAAIRCGRKFVGCEIDPGHFDVACKRIEQAHRQRALFTTPHNLTRKAAQPAGIPDLFIAYTMSQRVG